ncbi:hypothetical protein CSPAE12_05069, partial [Colletotrichum incanum]
RILNAMGDTQPL